MNRPISYDVNKKVNCIWWTLKLTYGLLFVVAGLDKFLNLVTHWEKYISPYVLKFIPLTSTQFIHVVGGIEIIIGLLILFALTRLGAYLAATWLLLIVVNLLTMLTYFDIAVRDVVMAIGAILLGQLTDVKDELAKN